jgi:hypothetical protein
MQVSAPQTNTQWQKEELTIFQEITSPVKIQDFLDNIPYSADPIYRSPRSVMRDQKAHCFDGALFAACGLRQLGFPPLIVDMRAVRDDDHIIAIYQRNGYLGAIAKSNFVGLRFREPIFRNLRELILSYFEDYYNTEGEKTLRAYSIPLDLHHFDEHQWMTSDEYLDLIADRLDKIRHYPLLTPAMEADLNLVDRRRYEAGMLGVNEAGLYKPVSKL